jgi:hypothetical protein
LPSSFGLVACVNSLTFFSSIFCFFINIL